MGREQVDMEQKPLLPYLSNPHLSLYVYILCMNQINYHNQGHSFPVPFSQCYSTNTLTILNVFEYVPNITTRIITILQEGWIQYSVPL